MTESFAELFEQSQIALVKLKPGAQADEAGIAEHCRKHLGGFQVPKLIRILDEMPMTATGSHSTLG